MKGSNSEKKEETKDKSSEIKIFNKDGSIIQPKEEGK